MWRLEGFTNIIAGGGTGYGILVMIGWLSLFGDTLFSVRMLMVLASTATAGVFYLTAKRWWNSQEAGAVALIFGIVGTSSVYSFVGRMDALGILAYSLCLLLHIYAVQQEKKWPHFFVGAAAILTVEFHVLGVLYVGALAFYYGVQYLRELIREKRIVLNSPSVFFFAGAGVFGLLYLVIHVLPNPDAYFIIPNSCDICVKTLYISVFVMLKEIMARRPIEFILLIVVLYTEVRNKRFNQHYFILVTGYILTHLIIKPPPWVQYYFPFIPLLAIGLGGFAAKLLEKADQKKRNLMTAAFLFSALLLLGMHFGDFYSGKYPYYNAYALEETREIRYIKENIPKSAVIMSGVSNFYQLKDYRNFLDARDQLRYGLEFRGEGLAEFLDRQNPTAIYLTDEFVMYFDKVMYAADEVLQEFISDNAMVHVTPELWVAPEFYVDP